MDLPLEEEREWYCVAFRSKRKDGSDGGRKCPHLSKVGDMRSLRLHNIALYDADKLAHEEAVRNGGVSTSQIVDRGFAFLPLGS